MTLQEAIERLTLETSFPYQPKDQDLHDAQLLGIEAFNFIQKLRGKPYFGIPIELPGETKE